jgi:signal transduction histidine kinase
MATVLFVLYFVIECAQIFLQLYQRGLDQMEALRDERDRARAAYEVKSQFVSVVSHELRTPLTSISGSLDLLRSGLLEASSEQAGRVVEIAWQNSKRLKALINDLLDLQKLESGTVSYKTGTENLSDIASEAVQSVAVIADKSDVKLALDLAEEPLILQADRARLMQVFANLLSNAIKFSNGPNTVTLKTWQDGKTVHASIRDRGIGIPEGSESVVFGKFGQVDSSDHRQHEGTGLGLSIVRQIVEAHEGTVSYTSVEGEGTTFTISFPARG